MKLRQITRREYEEKLAAELAHPTATICPVCVGTGYTMRERKRRRCDCCGSAGYVEVVDEPSSA